MTTADFPDTTKSVWIIANEKFCTYYQLYDTVATRLSAVDQF